MLRPSHGLGKWVDTQLQPIASTTVLLPRLYCLKQLLSNIALPPNALLFTADAKSMYTNILPSTTTDAKALIEAIEIVFKNNILQFGDTCWRQISGTGMGIAPAPPWATIYRHTREQCTPSLDQTSPILPTTSLESGFAMTRHNNNLWAGFKSDLQQWYGLEWEFSPLSLSCHYMDLALTVTNGAIHSTLFEKPQN
eukprot:CCRYP_010071-RA/>CCRYP_010071-RA protein AED:0.12 eAED:0.08 QI:0/0/0/0.75/0/0/4/0/195